MTRLTARLAAALLLCTVARAADLSPADVDPSRVAALFAERGVNGTLVLHDLDADRWLRVNPEEAARRTSPASTFKVFNTLVALDTGAVAGPDETFAWDGVERWLAAWNQDQTLRTALQRSALWVFQVIARRVGREPYETALAREHFGNAVVGREVDAFWIDGSLAISPDEQVAFLERLARGTTGFSDRAESVTRDLVRREQRPGRTLFAKTGWAKLPGVDHLWDTGWVEKDGRTVVFALRFSTSDPARADWRLRQELVQATLAELGLD